MNFDLTYYDLTDLVGRILWNQRERPKDRQVTSKDVNTLHAINVIQSSLFRRFGISSIPFNHGDGFASVRPGKKGEFFVGSSTSVREALLLPERQPLLCFDVR